MTLTSTTPSRATRRSPIRPRRCAVAQVVSANRLPTPTVVTCYAGRQVAGIADPARPERLPQEPDNQFEWVNRQYQTAHMSAL